MAGRFKAGDHRAPDAFRELLDFQFRSTVMHPSGQLRLKTSENRNAFLIAGPGLIDPLPLRDGRYLRFFAALELTKTKAGTRLRVKDAGCQYQLDKAGGRWIFRYDYGGDRSSSHLHIRGKLAEDCLPPNVQLADIHFPIAGGSIESIIRLLHEQFGVKCNTAASFWRPILSLSEELLSEMAHRPVFGPKR